MCHKLRGVLHVSRYINRHGDACYVAHSVERWTSNLKLNADAGSGIDCVKKCLHYMLHNNTLLKFRIKVFFGAPTP